MSQPRTRGTRRQHQGGSADRRPTRSSMTADHDDRDSQTRIAPIESDLPLFEKPQHAARGWQPHHAATRQNNPWIRSTGLTGWSMASCDSPGADPSKSTPAADASSKRMAVQPVGRRVSVKCPTLMPGTSVSDPAADCGDLHAAARQRHGAGHAQSELSTRAGRSCRNHTASYLASGSGRSWNRMTLLCVPLPVSMWNGARVLTVEYRPRPFQPPFGSSIRPSIHFV